MKNSLKKGLATLLCLAFLVSAAMVLPAAAAAYSPGQWDLAPGWSVTENTLVSNASGDSTTWNRTFDASTAFTISSDFRFLASSNVQTLRVWLGTANRSNNILMTINYSNSQIYIDLQTFDGSNWVSRAGTGNWMPIGDPAGNFSMVRATGSNDILLTVRTNGGEVYSYDTGDIGSFLNQAKNVGFVTLNSSPVQFSNIVLNHGINAADWNLSGMAVSGSQLVSTTSGDAYAYYKSTNIVGGFSTTFNYQFAGAQSCETLREILTDVASNTQEIIATVMYSNSQLLIQLQAWDGSSWRTYANYGWTPVSSSKGTITLSRLPNNNVVTLTVQDTGSFSYTASTEDLFWITSRSLSLSLASLSGSQVSFSNVQVTEGLTTEFGGLTNEWVPCINADGSICLMANTTSYSQVDYNAQSVQSDQWQLNTTLRLIWAASGNVCGRIFIEDANRGAVGMITATLNSQNQLRLDWQVFDGSNWITVYSFGNTAVTGNNFNLSLTRNGGNNLRLVMTNGSDCNIDQTVSNAVFANIRKFSFIADTSMLKFDNLTIKTLASASQFTSYADQAYNSLIASFWNGAGYLNPTYSGTSTSGNGVPWERSTMVLAMNAYLSANHGSDPQGKIESDLVRYFTLFKNSSNNDSTAACNVGAGSNNNWSDDAGWAAMMYMVYWQVGSRSGNATTKADAGYMLNWAKTTFDNAYNRWGYSVNGVFQGIYYNDDKNITALYAAALAIAGLDIYAADGSTAYRDKAIQIYQSLVQYHGRGDGLYWCNVNTNSTRTPDGVDRPYDINEAGSVSFIGGNMAMAVLGARLYRMTGDASYLNQAVGTINAITAVANKNGVLLNDRDAWTDGQFASLYASEALTLPGVAENNREVIYNTAISIMNNSRSGNYFTGDWAGGNAWENANGTTANQLMTSANTAEIVMAAAILAQQ